MDLIGEAVKDFADKSDKVIAGQGKKAEILNIAAIYLILRHRRKFHPYCDPKELDRVLKLLREEFERSKT